jgi:drug/metabolite transporter superfamily protein YnfA
MDRLATQFVDLLERQAQRVRSMSVDRVRHTITVVMVGMVAATLVLTALTFIVIGVFRYVGEAIGVTAAYAAFGGIFVVAGLLVWSRRDPAPPSED